MPEPEDRPDGAEPEPTEPAHSEAEPEQPAEAAEAESGGPGGPKKRKRRLWILAGLILAVIVAGVIVLAARKPHDVSHPDLSFTVTTTSTTSSTSTRAATQDQLAHFIWPSYGFNDSRTRDFTGDANLHPPFRQVWEIDANSLLEFPPVISGHTLYFLDDAGTVNAVDTDTGHVLWQRSVGSLSASSPGLDVAHGILVVPTLADHGKTPGNGQVIALSMRTGHALWSHPVPSGAESSPLVVGNDVYLGNQAGVVTSYNVLTGKVNWTFQASGAVKGGVAIAGNDLYLDDYGGNVYDISARTGREIWRASSDGGDLGFSSGTFYSTPAVAYGRVYVGNTSGYIYSFAANTGQLAWSFGTGAYVYSSAAVADPPGLGPTIYMGSYNGDFYALNAQSGKVRWVHQDAHHDAISGSATVVNNVVYYSDLHDKLTTGLNAATGQTVFSFTDGAFTPVVADPEALYVCGGYTLYKLVPKDGLAAVAQTPKRKATHPTKARGKQTHRTRAHTTGRLHLTAAQRAALRRAINRKLNARRAAERRAAERRAAEHRAAEQRAAEQRAAEKRAAAHSRKRR